MRAGHKHVPEDRSPWRQSQEQLPVLRRSEVVGVHVGLAYFGETLSLRFVDVSFDARLAPRNELAVPHHEASESHEYAAINERHVDNGASLPRGHWLGRGLLRFRWLRVEVGLGRKRLIFVGGALDGQVPRVLGRRNG